MVSSIAILAEAEWFRKVVNYEVIAGNELWRFGALLLVLLAAMAGGRILQYFLTNYADAREKKMGATILTLLVRCMSKPASVATFALGLYVSKLCVVFENLQVTPPRAGISPVVGKGWDQTAAAAAAIAVAYGLFKLVDIAEHYLMRWTSKTQTKLDDMLVPVLRKSLRVTIAIVAAMYIVDNILEQDVQSILLGAGIGGIAVALAAKDSISNFFGSLTIFADRPFQIDEMVDIEGNVGAVEEVGFRCTRIRTLEGHVVSVPNSIITNAVVKNIGKRPYIRRTSNITITYDSGAEKTSRAVEIIKDVLAKVPEVNTLKDNSPRVYFSDFNDWSLNIYVSYWVCPPDYWVFQQVNERVNFEIMKRFEAEGIEFAFPSQTLYVKNDQQPHSDRLGIAGGDGGRSDRISR